MMERTMALKPDKLRFNSQPQSLNAVKLGDPGTIIVPQLWEFNRKCK